MKTAVSAFSGNNLLAGYGSIGAIICCWRASARRSPSRAPRQAHDAGFQVTVLHDLCAAPTQEIHQQSLDTLQNLAEITRSQAWMKADPRCRRSYGPASCTNPSLPDL